MQIVDALGLEKIRALLFESNVPSLTPKTYSPVIVELNPPTSLWLL